MKVSSTKPDGDGKQQITVVLTIQKGYYIFANPTGNQEIEFARTEMKVSSKAKVDVAVTYPKGEIVKDEIVGNYEVYREQVTFKALVKRPKDTSDPLTLSVRVRPYDAAGCRWSTRQLKETEP